MPASLIRLTLVGPKTGGNDLFGVTTAADGSTWAVGWDIHPATDNMTRWYYKRSMAFS